MSKVAFCMLAILLFLVPQALAQSQIQDIVYLKNGSIIKGVIVERVPGVSITIETENGSRFVCDIADVEKITKIAPKETPVQPTVPYVAPKKPPVYLNPIFLYLSAGYAHVSHWYSEGISGGIDVGAFGFHWGGTQGRYFWNSAGMELWMHTEPGEVYATTLLSSPVSLGICFPISNAFRLQLGGGTDLWSMWDTSSGSEWSWFSGWHGIAQGFFRLGKFGFFMVYSKYNSQNVDGLPTLHTVSFGGGIGFGKQ